MSHFFESCDDGHGFLGVEEETAGFGFGSRGSNAAECFAEYVDCAVRCWSGRIAGGTGKGGQEKVSGSAAAGIWKDEICCVGTDGKDHVAGVIADDGVGVGDQVIEKHVACLEGMFGGRGLMIGYFVEGHYDGGIAAA